MVKRSEVAALYTQSWQRDLKNPTDATAFEVVLLRIDKPTINGAIKYAGGERLPTDQDWGTYGWTLPSLARALEKFDEVSTPEAIGRIREKKLEYFLTK